MIILKQLKLFFSALSLMMIILGCQQSSEFKLLSGESKSIKDYHGQWLLINFWAEWCPPCIKEIPELNALSQDGLQVLAVSYDKLSNHQLEQLIEKYKINYPVIATSPMPYLPIERPSGLPANYLFTPEGEMIGPLLGKQDRQSIKELIEKIESSQLK